MWTPSSPQCGWYMPYSVWYSGTFASGFVRKYSGKTTWSDQAHPTGNVSPTTPHCRSPYGQRDFPRSWMRMPVLTDRLGSLQEVLDLGEVSVGSLSSTKVFRYSAPSQTLFLTRVSPKYCFS